MSSFILEQDQLIRSVEISKNEAFSVLLGAGASITSGIPSAEDCVWEWKKSLYTSRHGHDLSRLDIKSDQVKEKIQKWLDIQGTFPVAGAEEEYSFYIEECYPIEEDRRKFFQRICAQKQPSIGYKLLCLLHEMNIIQSVWTTNFDDLGISAARATNLVPIEISLDSIDRIFRAQNRAELPYIKLHGDYKYGPLKNTTVELARQDATFRMQLVNYLNDKHLIVSGYSGRDASVMEALRESYQQPGAGRLYWCGYGREVPSNVAELLKLAQQSGRTAYYIPTDGFDSLFISLANTCTKNVEEYSRKFREYLSVSLATSTTSKFTIPRDRTDTIIKSNFFQVGFPQEVFQFELSYLEDEKPWAFLRALTARESIIAVPYKNMVYALGTLSDINRVFSAYLKGKITRIPLSEFNLQKHTAFHSLLLSALTDLLASTSRLQGDKRNLIWKRATTSQRMIGEVIYQTHQAIRLAINSDGERFYISFLPDFKVTAENGEEKITKDVFQEIGRTYFEKIWNSKFNEYINEWRQLLFSPGGGVIEWDYPFGSGSGFVFKIDRDNAFAGIISPRPSKVALSPRFNQKWICHRGIQYPEPELIFSPKVPGMKHMPRDFHPMRGISTNKPYDFARGSQVFDSGGIQLGVVCPLTDSSKFKIFLSRHQVAVDSYGVNKAYLLPFPGFQEAFATRLLIPDPGTDNWIYPIEPTKLDSIKDGATELRNQLIDAINKVVKDGSQKVVVIYIPNRWLHFTTYELENEHYDLHDYLKAFCAGKGIATQFIQEDTLEDPLQCQINWWLSLSYYVKSLRTPWVLDSLDKNTAFAGIGYSVTSHGNHSEIVLGCSHIYNSMGQGLKYRLSKVEDQLFWDRQKRPHLSYQDAYKFGASIIDMFYRTMDEFPKRVVIHKRTFFTKDEINGLKDSLLGNGIQDIDLIEVNFEEEMRYVAAKLKTDGMPEIDNYALPRGTCVLLNSYEALLWTHGVVPSVENQFYKFYLGGRFIPGPLRIKKHFGNSDLSVIATEILGLTKMNWNSFDLYSQLPATVKSSNEIARIGKLLSKKEGVTYDYRYFI